jgi:predicted transcriptional regulator
MAKGQKPKEGDMRLTVDVRRDLWRKVSIIAAQTMRSKRDVLQEALERYVEKEGM